MHFLAVPVTAAALVLLSGLGAVALASESSIRIDTYSIEADVEADGSLQVVETVTFAGGSRIPAGFESNLATWRVPQDSESLKIEDMATDITAANDSRITASYAVTGAFRAFSAADLADENPLNLKPGDAEILAEVIGPLDDVEIAEARVVIRTPGPALAAACFVDGQSVPVCTDRIGDTETTFRSLNVPAGSSVTIALVLDRGTVDIPAMPDSGSVADPNPLARAWGSQPGTAIAILLGLSLGIALAMALRRLPRWRARRD